MDKRNNNMNRKIAIIGVGHMGKALLKGFLMSGMKKENIILSNKADDNKIAAAQADWIILAVKPSAIGHVAEEIKHDMQGKLLISVAAALRISTIENYAINKKQKVIRIMPNIPVAYNQGVIGFYSNKAVSKSEKKEVLSILSLLGHVYEVKNEDELDILTLVAACGPAIVSYCITLLSHAAFSLGLSKTVADTLALHTYIGSLAYLQGSGLSP